MRKSFVKGAPWVLLLALLLPGAGALAAEIPPLYDATRYVFVPSQAAPMVTVIDSKTDTIVTDIELTFIPRQVVISEWGGVMVASNLEQRTLEIIDLGDLTTLLTIPLEITPDHMQLSPDGKFVAIGDIEGGLVSFVSLLGRRNLYDPGELFRVDGLARPYNMTFDAEDPGVFYVSNLGAGHISVIVGSRGGLTDEIQVFDTGGGGVTNVTLTPDGFYGYVTTTEGDLVTVIDMIDGKKIKDLETGRRPWRAYGTAYGKHMLVPNNGDGTVSVIDAKKHQIIATLPGGRDMISVNTGWFETTAFVTSRGDDKVVVIDLNELKKVADIPLVSEPGPGVVTPDGQKLYVALTGSDSMAVIDTGKRALIAIIEGVGKRPYGATMGKSNNYCH